MIGGECIKNISSNTVHVNRDLTRLAFNARISGFTIFPTRTHQTEEPDMAVDKNMPILIVDDYKTMLRIIRNLLKQLGFTNVDEATDGSMALQMCRASGIASRSASSSRSHAPLYVGLNSFLMKASRANAAH